LPSIPAFGKLHQKSLVCVTPRLNKRKAGTQPAIAPQLSLRLYGLSSGGCDVQKIFLSYRRDDAGGQALFLSRLLRDRLGKDLIFMDIDNVPFGIDFVEHIRAQVGQCDILLAVIGNQWLEARDELGNRRIDDPNDFVRLEISTALRRDIPVIPVLLDATKMPREDRLPDELKRFPYRSGINVHHTSFESDVGRLVDGLNARIAKKEKVTNRPFLAVWRRTAVVGLVAVILVGLVFLVSLGLRLTRTDSKSSEDPSAIAGNSSPKQREAVVQNSSDPATEQLRSYVVALQDARTNAATKIGVLRKISSLTDSQSQAFVALAPSPADCNDDKYAEPLALTLIDLARSNDRQLSALAQQTIEKLQAKSLFADFILRQPPECRGQWVLRLETAQVEDLLDVLKSKGVPTAELERLDVKTPDIWRTIIRPTATSEGDLYRVAAKIPSDDAKLKCLAAAYRSRFVDMQDGTQNSADPLQKEVELLKGLVNQTRTVGWYYKLFQRDLLVGAHRCNVEAVASH
jgi:hypothetical protein